MTYASKTHSDLTPEQWEIVWEKARFIVSRGRPHRGMDLDDYRSEIIIRALPRLRQYNAEISDDFAPYAYNLLRWTWIDLLRHLRIVHRHTPYSEHPLPENGLVDPLTPEQWYISTENSRRFWSAYRRASLPFRYRTIFERRLEGYTVPELAAANGVSISFISQILAVVKKRVCAEIGEIQ